MRTYYIMKIIENLLSELANRQNKNIPVSKRFQYTDLKRITKYLKSSIFDNDECSIWTGYITNLNNASKGVYINFYFRGKKIALHRLLYINFVGNLDNDEYIKFSCHNKGKCCNINHLIKYKYYNDQVKSDDATNINQSCTKKINKKTIDSDIMNNDFIVIF